MVEPPRNEEQGLPGVLIVLGALSVLVLLFALAIGLIAYGVIDIDGDADPTPAATIAVDGGDLQPSGFTVRASRLVEQRREIDVEVSVTNIGDDTLHTTTMIVQCLDNGNVSDSQLITSIAPDETLTYALTLTGIGEPACTAPVIDFDTP